MLLKLLGLFLLLCVAQQGAVVHELSHWGDGAALAAVRGQPLGADDSTCALCPAFAQVTTPAFSHSLPALELGRAAPQVTASRSFETLDVAAPRPRSRGPPRVS